MSDYKAEGGHILCDMKGVDFHILNDEQLLKNELEIAANRCGATVLHTLSHHFDPNGVTVLIMLSESHISIHTYPEKGACMIDCFTCGSPNPEIAINYLIDSLKPTKIYTKKIQRGEMNLL